MKITINAEDYHLADSLHDIANEIENTDILDKVYSSEVASVELTDDYFTCTITNKPKVYVVVCDWVYRGSESRVAIVCTTTDKAKAEAAMKSEIVRIEQETWVGEVVPKNWYDEKTNPHGNYVKEYLSPTEWRAYEHGNYDLHHATVFMEEHLLS